MKDYSSSYVMETNTLCCYFSCKVVHDEVLAWFSVSRKFGLVPQCSLRNTLLATLPTYASAALLAYIHCKLTGPGSGRQAALKLYFICMLTYSSDEANYA